MTTNKKRIPFPAPTKTLLQLLGPSILFIALSISGGEMLLWPSLTSNYGMNILWPILIVLVMQFVVNIEIERYTLVTGNSTEAHLVGRVRWLAALFGIAVVVSLVWPAWVTTSGNLLAPLLLPASASTDAIRNLGLVLSMSLLASMILVFRYRNTYALIEKISRIGLIIAISIIIFSVVLLFDPALFFAGLKGFFAFGYIPAEMPRFDFLGAVAYGGVAGVLNLVQSEWIRDKKYGAINLPAAKRSHIEFESTSSRRNFKKWFRLINSEHFLLFVVANVISIFLLSYLGSILLTQGSAHGFEVLVQEIVALNELIPHLGTVFSISGIIVFYMANITILDAIGRLTHQLIPQEKHDTRAVWTSSRISMVAIGIGLLILLSSLLSPSLKQPYVLLVTSASLSSIVMWLYPPLLLKLNFELPKPTRPAIWRQLIVILCTLFYGGLSLWALSSILPLLLIAVIGVVVTTYQTYFLFRKK